MRLELGLAAFHAPSLGWRAESADDIDTRDDPHASTTTSRAPTKPPNGEAEARAVPGGRARRRARHRGAAGDPVPPEPGRRRRRLHRRRPVLRGERVPHHHPAAARARRDRAHLAAARSGAGARDGCCPRSGVLLLVCCTAAYASAATCWSASASRCWARVTFSSNWLFLAAQSRTTSTRRCPSCSATCGRSRSRSSSTWSGRCCSCSCCCASRAGCGSPAIALLAVGIGRRDGAALGARQTRPASTTAPTPTLRPRDRRGPRRSSALHWPTRAARVAALAPAGARHRRDRSRWPASWRSAC